MEFEATEPGIEINGQIVYSSVAAFPMARCVPAKILLGKGLGRKINEKYHINSTDWYQQQDWLDALKEISSRFGDDALLRIGMKILEFAPFPETTKNLESALKQIDMIYHTNHRKNGRIMFDPNSGVMLEGIGHYSYSRNGKEYTIIVSESPYPCAFVKGILTAITKQFKPNAVVIHDDFTSCRKRGDKSCTYIIRW